MGKKTVYPAFEFKVGGKDLLTEAEFGPDLQEITVSESLARLDEVSVRVRWSDDVKDKMKALEAHGKEFIMTMYGETAPGKWGKAREIHGDVIELEFSRSGHEEAVTFRGLGPMHRLKVNWQSKIYEKMKQNAVATGVVKDSGLTGAADGTAGSAQNYIQGNVSDAEFLAQLQGQNPGFVMRTEKKKVRFVRADSAGDGTTEKVEWDNIRELRLRHSLEGVVAAVKAIGYDPVKGKQTKGEAKASDLKKISGGKDAATLAKKFKLGKELCFDNLSTGQDTVCKEMAKAELQKRADKFVQGNIEIEFAPKARSGGTLQIEGKNAPWPMTKAKFRISEVTHTYRDGEAPFTTIEFYSDSLPT